MALLSRIKKYWRWGVIALALLPVWPGLAQTGGPVVLINQVIDQDFPHISARVTVLDQSGPAIDNLGPANFLLWEDGRAVTNVSVAPVPLAQADPLSLVLALDVSGSMEEADETGVLKIEAARAEAKSLLGSLGAADQVAIIAFSETIVTAQPFTTDRAALTAALDGLQLDGDTALNDALFQAADVVGGLPPGKKAIILLTDGLNTHGNLTLDDALNRARQSGVPVYTVGFFTAGMEAGRRSKAEAALTRIATVTNGHYYSAPTAQQLGQTFQILAQLLRLQYQVSFESNLTADCVPHELKVRVTVQGQDGDDFDRFNACPPAPAIANLSGPADGAVVSKVISFTARIEPSPPVQIMEAIFRAGDVSQQITASPFNFVWDTTGLPPGPYRLSANIIDSTGLTHTVERAVTVEPPLTVHIITPAEGDELRSNLQIKVEVSGQGQVARLDLWWNDDRLATFTQPPFEFTLNTGQYLDGDYILRVQAEEADGFTTEQSLTVQVRAVTTNAGWWLAVITGLLLVALVIPLGIRARRRASAAAVPALGAAISVAPGGTLPPPAWLEALTGQQPGTRFALLIPETIVGRSRADNDIPVAGRTVSRRQATIKVYDGRYIFYDLHPTNPTLINQLEITGPHQLCQDDLIEIGDTIFKFTLKE
jgi:VWFA-related protein